MIFCHYRWKIRIISINNPLDNIHTCKYMIEKKEKEKQ